MNTSHPLVSLALPVRNGEKTIAQVAATVLGQDFADLEFVISDNASDDATEEICRELARTDSRVVYHRQPVNIGLNGNFDAVARLSRGTYLRWVSDDDWLAPTYVSRCMAEFDADPRLVRVTTQMSYTLDDGSTDTAAYDGAAFRSDDPVDRFAEMLRLLTESYLLLDPEYGLSRRDMILALPRPDMLREDEVFATRTALAGPWGHIPEVLAGRCWSFVPLTQQAGRLGVPPWHAAAATALECRAMLAALHEVELSAQQRNRGRRAVAQFYVRRWERFAQRGRRKLVRVADRMVSRAQPVG